MNDAIAKKTQNDGKWSLSDKQIMALASITGVGMLMGVQNVFAGRDAAQAKAIFCDIVSGLAQTGLVTSAEAPLAIIPASLSEAMRTIADADFHGIHTVSPLGSAPRWTQYFLRDVYGVRLCRREKDLRLSLHSSVSLLEALDREGTMMLCEDFHRVLIPDEVLRRALQAVHMFNKPEAARLLSTYEPDAEAVEAVLMASEAGTQYSGWAIRWLRHDDTVGTFHAMHIRRDDLTYAVLNPSYGSCGESESARWERMVDAYLLEYGAAR